MIFPHFPTNQARVRNFFQFHPFWAHCALSVAFTVLVSHVFLSHCLSHSHVFLSHLTLLVPAVPAAVLVPVSRHVYAIPTGFLSRKYLKGKLSKPKEVS